MSEAEPLASRLAKTIEDDPDATLFTKRCAAELRRLQASEEGWVRLLAEGQAAFNDLTDEKNRLQAEVEALRKALDIALNHLEPLRRKVTQQAIDAALAARPGLTKE